MQILISMYYPQYLSKPSTDVACSKSAHILYTIYPGKNLIIYPTKPLSVPCTRNKYNIIAVSQVRFRCDDVYNYQII